LLVRHNRCAVHLDPWTSFVLRVEDWLVSLGMSEYAQRFADNDIDASVLRDLTDQDLKELGVSLGHRLKMLRAIAEMTAASSVDNAERRQLAVMFCDLVGSTSLSTRLDLEDLRKIISAYQHCSGEVITKNGGFVGRYLGDGILAYFGYPQAHEDDAENAVRASLDLIAAVAKLSASDGTALQVRVGIATGLVLVGDLIDQGVAREKTVVGETPNLAARLQALAEPDTVVIDSTTRRLLGGLFEYRALGSVSIKGFADPIPAWQVTGASAIASRFEALRGTVTPLVDREEELELLMRRWQQAKAGDGSVVMISGEPGIGKSRIVETVLERLSAEPHARLRYFCLPHREDSPLYPAISQFERAAGFRRDDTAEQRLDKMEAVLAEGTDDVKRVAPLFAELLSIPTVGRYPPLDLAPPKLKQKTLQAKVAQIEGLAARQPVLMVAEDLHWSDPTSLELLDLLIERIPALPVLLIITFRPEFPARWVGRPHVTLLSISRLAPRQRAEMITHLVSGKALPKEIANQIMDRTDGVPLFIEEMTKAVLESGVLTEAADRYTAETWPPLAIPTTLQALLLARLDRLAPVREVAQIAATVGRHFSHELISAVTKIPQQVLNNALAQLVDAELIYRRGTPPDAEYTFKHALVQDAAYQSLLRSKQRQYHLQIARVLEERFPEIADAQPELLAHHYTQAVIANKAITYWQAAGQKAVRRSANAEAINHLTRGLELLKTMPESPERFQQELTLLLALGTPLTDTKGFASPEVSGIYSRARELCRHVGGVRQLFPVLWGMWLFYNARAEHHVAREIGEECHRLAESAGDTELLIAAHHARGVTLAFLGDVSASQEHLEQAVALYDPNRHRNRALISGIACRSQAAHSLWFLGQPDLALEKSKEALSLTQQLSRPLSLAQALAMAASVHQYVRDARACKAQAEAAVALSTEHEFPFWRAIGTILRGWALAEMNEVENGIVEMRQGLAAFRATGAECLRPYYLTLLAERHGQVGQAQEGLNLLSEAQAAVDRNGERWWQAEIYRLKGELMLKQCRVEGLQAEKQMEAEMYFHRALDTARRQGARSFELRATLSLCRLWQKQGKRAEARTMLADIYGWFTEGFGTADLQEAKTLLGEVP
jgi:predicted ATPase/class 3 adenylate cyclase